MATEIVFRSCPTCEGSCGLRCGIDRESRRVIRIEGDADAPRSQGYLCPKAYAMKEIFEEPERLRAPIRTFADGSWEEIDWDTVTDEVMLDVPSGSHVANGSPVEVRLLAFGKRARLSGRATPA